MEIRFERRYPDSSRAAHCVNLGVNKGRIYIALLLDQLAPESHIVYASPSEGRGVMMLAPFLKKHRVKLIENYSMGRSIAIKREALWQSIKAADLDSVELIESNFVEVWPTLSDVNFLLLDGPPNTTNFEPFSDNFIYMMHDINQRLGINYPGGSLESYLPYLCRAYDAEQFVSISDNALHSALKWYRDIDRNHRLFKEYGPHGWLVGRKT